MKTIKTNNQELVWSGTLTRGGPVRLAASVSLYLDQDWLSDPDSLE